jgi:hypothetical protein
MTRRHALYTPRKNSTAARVIAWLRENPEEELTGADVSAKFTVEVHSVFYSLKPACEAGLLVKLRNDKNQVVYRLPDLITQGEPA